MCVLRSRLNIYKKSLSSRLFCIIINIGKKSFISNFFLNFFSGIASQGGLEPPTSLTLLLFTIDCITSFTFTYKLLLRARLSQSELPTAPLGYKFKLNNQLKLFQLKLLLLRKKQVPFHLRIEQDQVFLEL